MRIISLSTNCFIKRYIYRIPKSIVCRMTLYTLMFQILIFGGNKLLYAAEVSPLPPDFIEFLGDTDSDLSDIKGLESFSLEELYQFLKKMIKSGQPSGKDETTNHKDNKNGDKISK